MSRETIERIVGRALLDREFLEALLERPGEALKDSGLSAEDRARVAATVREIGPAEARKLADAFQTQVANRKGAYFV